MFIPENTGKKKARPSISPKLGKDLARLVTWAIMQEGNGEHTRALAYCARLSQYLASPEYNIARAKRYAAKLRCLAKQKITPAHT